MVGWTNDLPDDGAWADLGSPYEVEEGRIDSFNGYTMDIPLPEIGSTQLATVTFELLAGANIDGNPDVWFIDIDGITTIGYIDPGDSEPAYHQVADITGHEGADVSAVPVPAAVYLLGSAFWGLIGIRQVVTKH